MGDIKPNIEFFQRLKENPHIVNYRAFRTAKKHRFSTYFKLMFQPLGHIRAKNMQTWFEAIASGFQINMDYVKPFMYDEACELFKELHLEPSEHDHLFQFWIYLNKVYITLLHQRYSGHDSIFGFMTGFPISRTKVVIVGQDPTRKVNSSGFAFHLSPCISTEMLVKFASDELSLVSQLTEGALPQLFTEQMERTLKSGELTAWIQQGVLLINSCLTSKHANWNPLVNYLIRYLSQNLNNLVFILVGNVAMEKSRFVDYKKHLVLQVYHPAWYAYKKRQVRPQNGRDWDRVLPFINANFYMHQKQTNLDPKCLIDWHHLATKPKREDRTNRLAKLQAFFLKVLEHEKTKSLEPGQDYIYCERTKGKAEGEEFNIRVTRGKSGTIYFSALKDKQ